MSKKDYVAIARALYLNRVHPEGAAMNDGDRNSRDAMRHLWKGVAGTLADTLQADNPRFDRARFMHACETGEMSIKKGKGERRLFWKAGDWLTISGHQSEPGKGLSYPPGDVQAAEDGFGGGWDVYDSTQEGSFYGFSVQEVR